MSRPSIRANPDLVVGADNKQRWNQTQHRRQGFHNAHKLFRRCLLLRAREQLVLEADRLETAIPPGLRDLLAHPAFSAFVCAAGSRILFEAQAADFDTRRPHSIQSVTKLHMHLIIGRLLAQGLLELEKPVQHYLPDIGSGYAGARIQDLLDMNLANDFSEDYGDHLSDCYAEEIALGWRLPPSGEPEITLRDFACRITGGDLTNRSGQADYKSANTDVLTLISAAVSPLSLAAQLEAITDAVGHESAFHISLSPEHLPAFSGGGCLSARDLARFGLLLARGGRDIHGKTFANTDFLKASLQRPAPRLSPPRDWLRYSNHLMTDGRLVGHAGYGGQFLLVDLESGLACAFLSVLENEAGHDEDYMAAVATALRELSLSVSP